MRREFSAGGVVVQRIGGAWHFAAIRPAGKDRVWALPKGIVRAAERPEEAAAREVWEETGLDAVAEGKLGDVRYTYTWEGERVFKIVSFFLLRSRGAGSARSRPSTLTKWPRPAGCPWPRPGRSSPIEASGKWLARRWSDSAGARSTHYDSAAGPPPGADSVYALSFYSPIVADQLRSRRKTATIRLGDKSVKYKKGMIVAVLAGTRFGPRERIFDAVIDKVEVKRMGDLSPREITHDNPELRRTEEMVQFLGQIYNRDVTEDDTVTVIYFSEILPPRP